MFSNFFFGNRAVYEIMWKYTVEPDRPQMTMWRMRVAWWVPFAANTLRICNIDCMNAPRCYLIRILPLFWYVGRSALWAFIGQSLRREWTNGFQQVRFPTSYKLNEKQMQRSI